MHPIRLLTLWCSICKIVTLKCSDPYNFDLIKYRVIGFGGKTEIYSPIVYTSKPVFSLQVLNKKIEKLCTTLFNFTYTIVNLRIENCGVEEIEEQFLHDQDFVETLRIGMNPIRAIVRHNFEKLQIQVIDLSKNLIEVVENEAFTDLSKLTSIRLNSNKIKYFNPNAFVNLPELLSLDLSDNKIKKLNERSFYFISQRQAEISFGHNLIQDVNEHVFDGLTAERVFLDMNHNQLDNLSFSIFKGHDFANADFGNNKIKTVSGLTEDDFVISSFNIDGGNLDYNTTQILVNWTKAHGIFLKFLYNHSCPLQNSQYLLQFVFVLFLYLHK
jgi:Leucine-rich repeat (LRR) protein